MSTREIMRQLATQEAASSSNKSTQIKVVETSSEQARQTTRHPPDELIKGQLENLTSLIEVQAKNYERIQESLDHVEKNLILQQPNVAELTKRLYPHIEATIKRCEATEERQTKLEEMVHQTEAMLAEFSLATEETLTKQQKENNDLFLLTQTKIINEYRGYQQLIHGDLENLRQTEASCKEMITECRKLAEQFSLPYEAAKETILELSQMARTQIDETRGAAIEAVEESRMKFIKTFRRLDTTLTNHPLLFLGGVFLVAIVLTLLMSIGMNRWLTERMVSNSIEASTALTQENLRPVVEKIQEQTKQLDLTYQQSENWEYYLSTLSYDQAQKLRWKVQQQVIERKQRKASQNLREH